MCGIAGYLANHGCLPDRSLLRPMCDRLRHRGPDGYGEFFDDQVALGHRRLSIIDVAGGAQPMGNEDGSIQVVFNGEIYNYLELRQDLKRRHHFATQSDTEVLVHLYEEVGERLPEYLNGMFAFAIWDARHREMFLARDRFGEKPLYYTFAVPGIRVCFASELKALTILPGFPNNPNAESIADFLSLSYVPDPVTIYRDVFKLRAGHSLVISDGGYRSRQYWAPVFSSDESRQFSSTIEEIKALAADAVTHRMISDVPLGGFLSGGVDSSAVVAFMSGKAPNSVKTFSIGFTDKEFDELPYARMVASRYGTEHHEQVVTPSVEEVLKILVQHYDEPFGDSSAIPTLYLAKMTRRYVTVALSGDGADELFGGYRRYRHGVIEERVRSRFPQWFREWVLQPAGYYYPKLDYLPQIFRGKAFISNLSREIGDAYFTSMSAFRDEGLQAVLSPAMRNALGGYSPRETFRNRFEAVRHLPPLLQMQAVDLQTYLPGDILVKMDRATMAHSLEARCPWLDYRLAELACGLPPSWKLRGKTGKYIFKQALSAYLPAEVLSRRKMGFAVPLANWFRTTLRPTFESVVLQPAMAEYLSLGEVRKIWREHQSGLHEHSSKLWNLLMLALWRERHLCASDNLSASTVADR